jgi:exosortase
MSQLVQVATGGDELSFAARVISVWWQPFALILLLGWLYHSILFRLAIQWCEDANFTHGFLVPPFALFIFWRQRLRFDGLPARPSSWGLLMVAFSLGVLIVGVLGAELFLARVSLLLVIAGLIVLFFGARRLRSMLFPLLFLILMIPIPAIVFDQITSPLQVFASQLAAGVLPWLGVPVLREGNIINLPSMSLEVAEACSGIRSLLSLITLAVIYGYSIRAAKWERVVLVLAAVPIAIVANGLRIVVTGLLVQYWSPEEAEGFFHNFAGWLVFLTSLAMLFSLQQAFAWRTSERRPSSGIQP